MGVKKITAFIFLFATTVTLGQFPDKAYYLIDSLQKTESNSNDFKIIEDNLKLYHSAASDTLRLNILSWMIESINDEAIWSRYNSLLHRQSSELINKTSDSLLRKKFLSKKAQAINNYGFYLQNYTDQPGRSLAFYQQAEKIQSEIGDKTGMVISKNNIANYLYNTGSVLQALTIFHETIRIQEDLKNVVGLTPLLNNIAETYMFLGDTAKAYIYLKRALASSIQSGDKRIIAQELQNVGVLASYQGQKDYAMDCIKKALAIREQIGDVVGLCKSKINLAGFCLKDKDLACTRRYLKEIENHVQTTDNLTLKFLYHSTYGQLYFDTGEFPLSEFHHQTALKYAHDGKSVQDEIKSINYLLKLYNHYSNPESELQVHRRRMSLEKKLNTSEIRRTALQKEYEFEYKRRESELKAEQAVREEKNRSEKRRQKFIILGISVILLITLVFFFFIFKAFTRIKQKNKIISLQKQEVEKQKQLVEHKQKEILDSIKYAKRIQQSLLPTEKYIEKNINSLKKD